jgi:hypothetical protein
MEKGEKGGENKSTKSVPVTVVPLKITVENGIHVSGVPVRKNRLDEVGSRVGLDTIPPARGVTSSSLRRVAWNLLGTVSPGETLVCTVQAHWSKSQHTVQVAFTLVTLLPPPLATAYANQESAGSSPTFHCALDSPRTTANKTNEAQSANIEKAHVRTKKRNCVRKII